MFTSAGGVLGGGLTGGGGLAVGGVLGGVPSKEGSWGGPTRRPEAQDSGGWRAAASLQAAGLGTGGEGLEVGRQALVFAVLLMLVRVWLNWAGIWYADG